jgi:hypothetical protein
MLARKTARLSVDRLEDRSVPAIIVPNPIPLTSTDATALIYGAYFRQDGNAVTQPTDTFLSMDTARGGTDEQGYNTDNTAQPLDTLVSHSVQLSAVPRVSINGANYLEFLLNVNETHSDPLISLDDLKVWVGPVPNLTGLDVPNGALNGLTAIYDLDTELTHQSSLGPTDTARDNWVVLDNKLGSRKGGDMLFYLPESAVGTDPANQYIYLYSKFGVNNPADGKAESWSYGVGGSVAPANIGATIAASSLVQNLTNPFPPVPPAPPPPPPGGPPL